MSSNSKKVRSNLTKQLDDLENSYTLPDSESTHIPIPQVQASNTNPNSENPYLDHVLRQIVQEGPIGPPTSTNTYSDLPYGLSDDTGIDDQMSSQKAVMQMWSDYVNKQHNIESKNFENQSLDNNNNSQPLYNQVNEMYDTGLFQQLPPESVHLLLQNHV